MNRTSLFFVLIILSVTFLHSRSISAQVSLILLHERNRDKIPEFHFQAKGEEGFLFDIDDFRLERIEPTYRWIPLLFGDEDMQRQLLDDELIQTIDFTLKAVVLNQRDELLRKLPMVEEEHYRIAGEALLDAGATYKLTLKVKTGDGKVRYESSVPFKTKENSALSQVKENEPMSCPCYLGEILFFDKHDNLYLGQKPMWNRAPTPAASFRNGAYIEPPDPRYEKVLEIRQAALGNWKPPLAKSTHHWRMSRDQQTDTFLQITVSDLATNIDLPESGPTLKVFSDALFRVSKIEGNLEKLRQDEQYWKTRCTEIMKEASNHPSEDVRKWAHKQKQRSSASKQ